MTLGPVDQEPCYRSQQCVFQRLVSAIRSQLRTRLQLSRPDSAQYIYRFTSHGADYLSSSKLYHRIDPLRFLAGCRRKRLNQGLVVALGFSR